MQVMHRSPVLGQSPTLTTPTASTINTTAIDTTSSSTTLTSNIICFSSITTTNDSLLTSIPLYVKRGHKYHVPSACVNCKKAHLACDVSRPCKRCVFLDKTDTCLDIKHKKRGRPKRPPKKPKTDDTTTTTALEEFRVMRGTIQTPNVDNSTTTPQSHPATDILPTPKPISFCHQPIETFHKSHQVNTYLKSIQGTRLTPSSPIPSEGQTDSTLAMTFDRHDGANNTTISPSSPSSGTKMTLILTMELCCARLSDDTTMAWGYYPQELAHRSMYDFIAVQATTRLSQLHRRLLDNVMEASSRQDPIQRHQAPPSTERTTSDLFHQKTIKELSIKANGSHTFADSLYVKTRSGRNELYDVCVYLGGGLGADLEEVSTLTKLYIVMVYQKKNVDKMEQDQHQQQQQHNILCKPPPSSACSLEQTRRSTYKTILPLLAPAPVSPSSPSSTTSNSSESPATAAQSLNRYTAYRNRPIQPKPHDLRHVSLPAHFANNSSLNTISFGTHQASPKINIAPSSSTIPSSSSIPYAYFRPIASAPAATSASQPSPSSITTTMTSSTAKDEQNTLTTIAYRPTSSSPSSMTSTGPRKIASIDHPTTQYFSQTSSSKAAQNHSGPPDNHPPPSSISSSSSSSASEIATSRKKGMSIRSLLC